MAFIDCDLSCCSIRGCASCHLCSLWQWYECLGAVLLRVSLAGILFGIAKGLPVITDHHWENKKEE